MIVFIRCNDIISDSRAKKYLDFYDRNHVEYKIIAWDRLGNSEHLPNSYYCPLRSKYEQGGLAAIRDRIRWMYFILCTLFSFHSDLKIHACDLDAAFPVAVYKMLSRRKNKLVFDVFDWISDTLYNQPKLVLWAFAFMEYISIRKADHVIICEPERIKQIPYDINGRFSVLPNIPSFNQLDFLECKEQYRFDNDKLTLCYVGGLVPQRCLKELIQGAADGFYNLNIAGYGNQELTEMLEKNRECENIRYYGKVPYKEGLCIMYNSDIMYAMYAKENPNHVLAAPNKYYEAMLVGKPIITTNGIIVADKVRKNGMGFSIDENLDSLKSLVSNLEMAKLEDCMNNSSKLWNKYKNYTEEYLMTTYSEIMFSLPA